MPDFGLNFWEMLSGSGGAMSAPAELRATISRYKQELLNIPIQSHGEEYVKRYANRFSTR